MFESQSDTKKESCCVVESNGHVWCFKSIVNIKTRGYTKTFICCGQRCNCKVFFTDQVNFVVDGFHTCLFDHEREFRKRQRNKIAQDAMKFNMTLRPRDVVEHVKTRVRMTTSEERALFKYVSRNIARCCPNVPRSMAEFVIPDELKRTITEHGDVGDSDFLIHDSTTGEDAHDRIIIFASYGMRRRAAMTKELYADGTYRTISNLFGTLYTIHGDVDGTLYPIFFILMENEQKTSFARAFEFTKPFLQSFNEQCVVHVDCQIAAIGAFKGVFGCRIRLCLFHQNQSVWKAVSRYKLAAAYNSMTNKRLHIWIRRLLSLPFLPERV